MKNFNRHCLYTFYDFPYYFPIPTVKIHILAISGGWEALYLLSQKLKKKKKKKRVFRFLYLRQDKNLLYISLSFISFSIKNSATLEESHL